MKNKATLLFLIAMSLSYLPTAVAQAPVVDLSKDQSHDIMASQDLEIDQGEAVPSRSPMTHQNEPMDQRVMRLERQISNLAEMNYSSKMEKLQQELQQLQGQIEVQNHELNQIKEQLRNFYTDLDQRITKGQTANDKNTSSADPEKNAAKVPTASENVSNKGKELQSYEAAFNLLNKKEYDQAISGFQNFIKEYPDGSYTANAHYWLGEIYFLKGKSDLARGEFQTIITKYPSNPKVADAMLKVALISMDAGNYSKAKADLLKVQKQFPNTTAAKIAALRLKEIKQSGH